MATIDQLHAQTLEILQRQPNDRPVAAPEQAGLAAVGPAEQDVQFAVFRPSHLRRALDLASQFMTLANATPGDAGLAAVLAAAEEAMARENVDLVKYALMVFITHHPEGRRLPIPPLDARDPRLVLPSRQAAAAGAVELLGALGAEAQVDYFREDSAVNDHHTKWHVVYPFGGHPNPDDPQGPNVTKNREGELFWYMHQQMLARYDTERRAFGLPLTEPLADYQAPIPEGYDANLPGFSNRPPAAVLADIQGYGVADHELRRDRLARAAQSGFFVQNGNQVPITPSLLGSTLEASVDSVDGPSGDPLGFYGNFHNLGHVLLAALHDPNGPFPDRDGVMISTSTAVRDPVFFRWHRHIDDLFFAWQDTLAPNDFSSQAPPVRLRKDAGAGKSQSPDILLCLAAAIPGAGQPGFDGQAFGEATFGGSHWGDPPQSFPVATGELHTLMRQQTLRQPNGSVVNKPYVDFEEFFYFLRLENQSDQPQTVTVRIFLAASEVAANRRCWIEMDKFAQDLRARERRVVFRPSRLSSVVRKPARRPSEPRPLQQPGTADLNYCDCGWPYHLLLPIGTPDGMPCRLLVMLTDFQADLVGAEKKCGSMSFCGARDADYPDSRAMGYPFDRRFGGATIESTIAGTASMAARDLTIKHLGRQGP